MIHMLISLQTQCDTWHFRWHTAKPWYWVSVSLRRCGSINIDDLLKRIYCKKSQTTHFAVLGTCNVRFLSTEMQCLLFWKCISFAQIPGLKWWLRLRTVTLLDLSSYVGAGSCIWKLSPHCPRPCQSYQAMTDCTKERVCSLLRSLARHARFLISHSLLLNWHWQPLDCVPLLYCKLKPAEPAWFVRMLLAC